MKNLKNGVFLSTVHSLKGQEFNHVFVLGGSWSRAYGEELEEERRLYYVAMTRARQTLNLFNVQDAQIHHAANLSGEAVLPRTFKPRQNQPALVDEQYIILGMKELYVDYAGQYPRSHDICRSIGFLHVEDKLVPRLNGQQIEFYDHFNEPVARIAKAIKEEWLGKLDKIRDARVFAMVQRTREDVTDEQFLRYNRVDVWEMPIVEVRVRG